MKTAKEVINENVSKENYRYGTLPFSRKNAAVGLLTDINTSNIVFFTDPTLF